MREPPHHRAMQLALERTIRMGGPEAPHIPTPSLRTVCEFPSKQKKTPPIALLTHASSTVHPSRLSSSNLGTISFARVRG